MTGIVFSMMPHTITRKFLPAVFTVMLTFLATIAHATEITVYKSPTCGCCSGWVDHMKSNGYSVISKDVEDLDVIKKMLGVPLKIWQAGLE